MRLDAHACPVHGCTRQVPDSLLMCRPHWRLVPAHMQSKLYHAWRVARRHFGQQDAASVSVVEHWLRVRELCIEAVNAATKP